MFSTNDTTPNQDFCTTYELNVLQSGIGQNLTTHNFVSSIVNGLIGNATLSKSLVCTTCAEGAYAVVRPQLGNRTQQEVDAYFSEICGSNFQGGFLESLCVSSREQKLLTRYSPFCFSNGCISPDALVLTSTLHFSIFNAIFNYILWRVVQRRAPQPAS